MAANKLGGLIVTLGLDAAEFTSGLTKAEREAQLFAARLDKGIKTAANLATIAVAAIATAATAAFLAIDNLTKQTANFQDLSEKTGASAEGLASMSVAAQVAGTNMDIVAEASIKLTKGLTGVDDESKLVGSALKALGIPIKEFKKLDPAAQFEAIAKALDKFEDGSSKTAVALALIPKTGAQLLPFFKELAQEGGRQVILTDAQIKLADEYADSQKRLSATINLYAQVIASSFIKPILAAITVTKEIVKEFVNVDKAAKDLRDGNAIQDFANNTVEALGFIVSAGQGLGRVFQVIGETIAAGAAQTALVAQGNFKGALAVGRDFQQRMDELLNKQLFSARLATEIKKQNQKNLDVGPRKPILDFQGTPDRAAGRAARAAARDAAAEDKQILEGTIRALEASINRERDILNARQDFLRDSYSEGFLSVANYYDKLQQARDENLQKAIAAYDTEIEATRAFQAKLTKESERQDAQNKINDILEKQAGIIRNAQFAEEALTRDRTRATEQYGSQLEELNAKMLELAGNTARAAAIRFDTQNRVFNRSLGASGNTEALAQQEAIKAQIVLQASLNDKNRDFQLILDTVSIAQERIGLAQQTGAIGEIEALNQLSTLNKSRISDLQRIADAYAVIAAKSKDPADLLKVEQLRLAIERLGAQTDLVAKKFTDIFAGSFADALTDVVTGTKSLSDAFKSMEKQIVASISRIASQNIAEALFGKTGALGGIGGLFASLFSSKPATVSGGVGAEAAGATAADAALVTLSATTVVADTQLVAMSAASTVVTAELGLLAGAATTAVAALARITASSATSGIGSAIGEVDWSSIIGEAVGGFAAGGSPPVGRASLVGEFGPELFVPRVAGNIIPNSVLEERRAKSVTVNNFVTVPQSMSRPTRDQLLADIGKKTQKATARNA